jgi:hypothetical protein
MASPCDCGIRCAYKREFLGKRSKYGQFVGRKVIHDLLGESGVVCLGEITFHETLHVRVAAAPLLAAEDLQVRAGKMMVRILVELILVFGFRQDPHRIAIEVWIGFVARESVDSGIGLLQGAKHVAEGTVLHHQHYDVLQILQSNRHHPSPSIVPLLLSSRSLTLYLFRSRR